MSDEQVPGQSRIDPRFDPAFQRGFEGAVTTTRRRPTAGASVLPATSQASTPARPTLAPQRITADSIPAAPPAQAPATAQSPTADAEELPEDEPQPSRANGIFVVLFVLAGVLVGFGAWAAQFAIAAADASNLGSQSNFVLIQLAYTSAPLAIALGIAIAAGTLLGIAIRRR